MNKKFENPELEIIRFENADVIATSAGDDDNKPTGGGSKETEED